MEYLELNSSREKTEWSAPEVITLESAATAAGKAATNPTEDSYATPNGS